MDQTGRPRDWRKMDRFGHGLESWLPSTDLPVAGRSGAVFENPRVGRIPSEMLSARRKIMARLSVYDPFAEVFPELFRGVLQPLRTQGGEALEIKVEVKESNGDYIVQAEMPGVKKEDIHVQIDGNRVAISAEVKRESEQKGGERVLRSERYYGSVAHSFTLAAEVDESRAVAKFDNGVLSLTLPKKVAPAAKRLEIQ